ncbi:MAG TPA: type II secretion system protein [Lentisphaeria bacterium]|nr:type II secretion system protein [Lentisphaeria bacterium]
MKRPVRYTKTHYTLVEIMVAIAILVIMMGFLFQFVIGAQRIWSSSESTSNTFEQAQIALQLIENDLQSTLYANDKEYPGHSVPMGVKRTGSLLDNKLFMVAPDSSASGNVGVFLVMYALDNNELSRYVFDSPIPGYANPHCFYGFDPVTTPGQASAFMGLLDVLEGDNTKKNVLATGVQEVRLDYMPNTPLAGANFFTSVPSAVRITLTVYDARAVQRLLDQGLAASSTPVTDKIDETTRVFTKVIFMR